MMMMMTQIERAAQPHLSFWFLPHTVSIFQAISNLCPPLESSAQGLSYEPKFRPKRPKIGSKKSKKPIRAKQEKWWGLYQRGGGERGEMMETSNVSQIHKSQPILGKFFFQTIRRTPPTRWAYPRAPAAPVGLPASARAL